MINRAASRIVAQLMLLRSSLSLSVPDSRWMSTYEITPIRIPSEIL